MKKTRRIAAFAAAMAMAATMAMPMAMNASAYDVTITNSVDEATHAYEAYQIFSGDLNDGKLANIQWGTGITAAGQTALGDADTYATTLAGLTTDAQKKAAAKTIGGYLSETTTGEYDAATKKITGLTAGYYLIKDSDAKLDSGAKTSYILFVSADDSVAVKTAVPEVMKKVQENQKTVTGAATLGSVTDAATTKWNDVADYNVGDAVPFKLYGTMPSNLDEYSAYYYKFVDTLDSHFAQPDNFTITVGTVTLTASKGSDGKYAVMNGTVVDKNCAVTWDAANHKLEVEFENVKEYAGVETTTVVTVVYDAVLNSGAAIGLDGQMNAVKLEYSNNPNFVYNPDTTDDNREKPKTPDKPGNDGPDGTPGTSDDVPSTPGEEQTGETPEDKVIVFTYQLDIDKIDEDGVHLDGAVFTIQAKTGIHAGDYLKVDAAGYVVWGTTTPPTAETVADADATAGTFTATSTKLITIKGLDDGDYVIKEIVTPSGYNSIPAAGKTWTISATTGNVQNWTAYTNPGAGALTAIDLTEDETSINEYKGALADPNKGMVKASIENKAGSTLPTTGGMGTRLFVLGGGCMAGLAGLYLVSKKRSKDAE